MRDDIRYLALEYIIIIVRSRKEMKVEIHASTPAHIAHFLVYQ